MQPPADAELYKKPGGHKSQTHGDQGHAKQEEEGSAPNRNDACLPFINVTGYEHGLETKLNQALNREEPPDPLVGMRRMRFFCYFELLEEVVHQGDNGDT